MFFKVNFESWSALASAKRPDDGNKFSNENKAKSKI
jgi:hypothetical protein